MNFKKECHLRSDREISGELLKESGILYFLHGLTLMLMLPKLHFVTMIGVE